jgi:hypothetical protein
VRGGIAQTAFCMRRRRLSADLLQQCRDFGLTRNRGDALQRNQLLRASSARPAFTSAFA